MIETEISVVAQINTYSVLDDLITSLTHEELIEAIQYLDSQIADWSFTEELRDYFNSEMEKEYD